MIVRAPQGEDEITSVIISMYQEMQSDLLPTLANARVIAGICIQNPATLIAIDYESKGDTVGGIFVSDSNSGALRYRHPIAMGWGIWIREDYRGSGLAQRLMVKSKDILREMGVTKIVGQARLANKASRILMRHMGFREDPEMLIHHF